MFLFQGESVYSESMPEQLTVITPENIELRFQMAGLYSRGQAQFYDFFYQIVASVVLYVSPLFIGFGGYGSSGIYAAYSMIVYFLLFWGYYPFFELYCDGQTPGKRKLGLRVVTVDGGRIGFAASLARNILRVVDFLPLCFLTGMAAVLFSERHQRLGDLAAGTIVIRDAEVLPRAPGDGNSDEH